MTSGAPGVHASSATASETPSADERWTRWLAKGAAHDRRMRERMRYVTALIAAGFLTWLAIATT